jgi:hypothetical protein
VVCVLWVARHGQDVHLLTMFKPLRRAQFFNFAEWSVIHAFLPGAVPERDILPVQKAHQVHITTSCCRDESPCVDGTSLVQDVLQAAHLLWSKMAVITIGISMAWAVRVYWEALGDQQLDTVQTTLDNCDAEKVVLKIGAVLKCKGEALDMACIPQIGTHSREPPEFYCRSAPKKNAHHVNLLAVQI